VATGEIEGNNAICTGETTCAKVPVREGREALRWQQGASGSCGAGPCWLPVLDVALNPLACSIVAQWEQPNLAGDAAELQSASPSAGAMSTARSSPEAMSLRNCINRLYTGGELACVIVVTDPKKKGPTPSRGAGSICATGV
jgi:hypothetical protein